MNSREREKEYDFDVDVIVTWVDDSDEEWQKKRNFYQKTGSLNGNARYRDMGTFEYFFLGMQAFAPWVRKIFVVTDDQKPDFEIEDSRVEFISHKDYIPEEALPTFNSNTIEMNFDLIPGLAERFILFNDDTLLVKKTEKSDFFASDGTPKDYGVLDFHSPYEEYEHIVVNNMILINNFFNKAEMYRKNIFKYASPKYGAGSIKSMMCYPWINQVTWRSLHLPVAYKVSEFKKIHQLFPNLRARQNSNRFRTKDDISHWLIRYWRLAEGDFEPAAFHKYGVFTMIENNLEQEKLKDLLNENYKILVLNDNDELTVDVVAIKKRISSLLDDAIRG